MKPFLFLILSSIFSFNTWAQWALPWQPCSPPGSSSLQGNTLYPGFFISKVWERKNKRVQQYLPEVPSVNTYEDILQDDSIELVIVNTPEHTHFDFARRALEAGKHVVVEKAFTVNDAEAQQLIQLAGERDLVLSVFQNRRWDSDFLTVRKILDQQLLGRLVSYEVHYDRYRNFIQAGTWKERPGPGKGPRAPAAGQPGDGPGGGRHRHVGRGVQQHLPAVAPESGARRAAPADEGMTPAPGPCGGPGLPSRTHS